MQLERDQSSPACGDQIAGRYQLIRPIGEGGMGVVWVAHNLVLDVHVAVKLIRGALAGPGAAARLLREARSAARVAHPGVVRVFDHGTTDRGDPFIVMELLEGETLRHFLTREERLPPLRAAALLLPVADALSALVEAGIVHRDLKPENIVLTPKDAPGGAHAAHGDLRVTPKLVDFGVAFLPGMDRLTWAGSMVGTPDYLAPEQADGLEVDARADVWAFSVMLFEAIAGERPFDGDSLSDLIRAIFEQPAPSLVEMGACDEHLAAIVARGLAKDREDRWPSMREMRDALSEWASLRGLTEDVSGAAIRPRSPIAPRRDLRSPPPKSPAPAPREGSAAIDRRASIRPSDRWKMPEDEGNARLVVDVSAGHVRIGSSEPFAGDDATTQIALTRRKNRHASAPGPAKPTRVLPGWSERPPDPIDASSSRLSAPDPASTTADRSDARGSSVAPEGRWMRRAVFVVAASVIAAAFLLASLRRPERVDFGDPTSAPSAVASVASAPPSVASVAAIAPSATGAPASPSSTTTGATSALPPAGSTLPRVSASPGPKVPAKPPDRRIDDLKDPYRRK